MTNPLSLLFIFSYLFFVTYILTPLLILCNNNMQIIRADIPSARSLLLTMVLALLVWFIVLIGYKNTAKTNIKIRFGINFYISRFRLIVLTLISGIFFIYIFYDYIVIRIVKHSGFDIFKFSNGNGYILLLASSCKYWFIFNICNMHYNISNKKNIKYIDIFITIFIVFILFISATTLSTRRDIAIIFLATLYLLIIIKQKLFYKICLLTAIILIPMTSAFLQIFRYVGISTVYENTNKNMIELSDTTNELSDTTNYIIYFVKQNIVSTFEGHWLAVYLDKVKVHEFIFGTNWFEFLGNIASYIPRSLWNTKPYDLGLFEIQKYLVPNSFYKVGQQELPILSLPPTILVELMYSFGILGTLIISYYVGKIFYVLDSHLKNNQHNIMLYLILLYAYLYMFDFIRGGTAFIMNIVIMFGFFSLIIKKGNLE